MADMVTGLFDHELTTHLVSLPFRRAQVCPYCFLFTLPDGSCEDAASWSKPAWQSLGTVITGISDAEYSS